MKKQIIITIILLVITVSVTVVYFKNLNTPGMRTSQVMRGIPGNASFILEFNNDKAFYDIFNGSPLFAAVAGKQQLGELDTLRSQLLENSLLAPYFTGQNIFISIHPSKTNAIALLLTMPSLKEAGPALFDRLTKQAGSGLLVTPTMIGGKPGYTIYINALKKRFYVINKEGNIFSGSFSKELIDQCAVYKSGRDKQAFVLLPEQQNANSLASLYVNYQQLSPLFDQLFKNKSTDIFKSMRLLPGLAALSLNYRSDALMFNGITNIQKNEAATYLNLFASQEPVTDHLKDIFPSTTAYSVSFALADPGKFETGLSQFHIRAGLKDEKDRLFNTVRAETGISLQTEFNNLLGNEFAVVTTRYMEKFAIIAVKDGSKLNVLLTGISKPTDQNSGQFNYDKLPFFLLGDVFAVFKRPYFMIIDNYLILANSAGELASYYDTYINRKFLSKNEQFNQFDNLLAEKSNVAFFFHFKNSQQILKRDMYPDIYNIFETNEAIWQNIYAASWQFTATNKNFYTNFCMKLNTGTTIVKN